MSEHFQVSQSLRAHPHELAGKKPACWTHWTCRHSWRKPWNRPLINANQRQWFIRDGSSALTVKKPGRRCPGWSTDPDNRDQSLPSRRCQREKRWWKTTGWSDWTISSPSAAGLSLKSGMSLKSRRSSINWWKKRVQQTPNRRECTLMVYSRSFAVK